ncbi:MAG: hypothetical protein LBN20_04170, partial [Endomicrobium sp.]|nr:hypothetical protein [Endomicrobium sp.]
NEKSIVLEEEEESDIDIASYAYQIWKEATDKDHKLKDIIPALSDVAYSAKESEQGGAIVYTKTGFGNDVLKFIDKNKQVHCPSPIEILEMAKCPPDETASTPLEIHHDLVRIGVEEILKEETKIGGQLGSPSSIKNRLYRKLNNYQDDLKIEDQDLKKSIQDIYNYPLTQKAKELLSRQIKSGISGKGLFEMVHNLRLDGELCIITDEPAQSAARIICSMSLS